MPDAPQEILDLVATFKRNQRAYTSSAYNEAQARSEFIDKLFIAFGWDVYNAQGSAPQYREVVTEAALGGKEGSRTPDYTFRVGGSPVFFVEAKKPQLDLSTNTDTAFQIRTYAWNKGLKASILTDFHEFAVYDCQIKPKAGAKASEARVLYLTYEQYADQWGRLYDTFSRQAVWNGSFDNWAAANTGKQGTQTVDAAFLADMSDWRELLAHNLALRNPTLSDDDLNYAVQMTLDRIVFWRICEDRGIEPLDQLRHAAQGREVYQRLLELFRRADQRYNSGLFHFASEKNREAPDILTPALHLDDATLKQIIDRLYWPAPYNFSQMPVEILGRVYEQFLGSVIRLTPAHQAKVETKPEVRKAGGVYYTPQYIVRYIVEHTVGELVKDRTPAEITDLAVCDPACGSGSFLLGAFEYLLAWYRDWYTAHRGQRARKEIYEGRGGEWLLTVEEKKRILTRHIYGVDIDPQAVEVTKLSLLLKVLEGENEGSMQLKLLQERALPDLGNNIKCGNSLIGWDYPGAAQLSPAELKRINPFDWHAAFPQVFARGGFDAVIGNPPYLKEKNNKAIFDTIRMSTSCKYCTGKMDLWYVFACVSIDLVRNSGLHSFIATNNWTTSFGASLLRRKVMKETQLVSFVDFSDYKVFRDASIQTMTYVMRKIPTTNTYLVNYYKVPNLPTDEIEVSRSINDTNSFRLGSIYPSLDDKSFTINAEDKDVLLQHIENITHKHFESDEIGNGIDVLQDFVAKSHLLRLRNTNVQVGDGIFVITAHEKDTVCISDNDSNKVKPYYTTKELSRYYANSNNTYWIIYADKSVRENINAYPGIREHLNKFKPVLTSAFKPYGLHRPRDEMYFHGNVILSTRKTRRPSFTYVKFTCYVSRAFLVIKLQGWHESIAYITGILNSRVISHWLYYKGKKQGDQLQIDKEPLLTIPIRTIDFSNPADAALHDQMVALVERMLQLNKDLAAASAPPQRELLERQIKAADAAIDRLVYELYGLTPEEIALVKAG